MNNFDETILHQIIDLHESGKTTAEIIALFPDNKEEVTEACFVFDALRADSELAKPPRELLSSILKKLPADPMHLNYSNYQDGQAGSGFFKRLEHALMPLRYGFSVILALLVIAFFAHVHTSGPQAPFASQNGSAGVPASSSLVAVPTGNVDDVLNFLYSESNQTQALVQQSNNETASVPGSIPDAQDITGSSNE